jgi:PAS domain S-box-containing protein
MTDHPGDAQPPDSDGSYDQPRGRSGANGRSVGPLGRIVADGSTPTVLLLLRECRNRRLLAESLAAEATVTATADVDALSADVDLCIVDRESLDRHRGEIVARRAAADPVFLPVVLVDPSDAAARAETWTAVDEVIPVPLSKAAFRARLRNLLVRRRQSRRLADREAELETALTELRVRDRAIAEAPIGITIADAAGDHPLVYANDAFLALTGYDWEAVVGRNCRFLQGAGTDEASVREMRAAIGAAEPVSVDVVNYTRDGERFWNKVDIAPVRDGDGDVTHFVGFQTDITPRKLHEQRVNVLNRLLRHNLRNELNVIDGYTAALEEADGEERSEAIDRVRRAVARLVSLSEEVGHVEHVFGDGSPDPDVRTVSELLEAVRAELGEQYPDVTVHIDVPADPVHLSAESLSLGCVDYVAMLLSDNAREERSVSIVATHDATADVVDIAISDNGPGLAESDWAVIEAGHETPLRHADRLGLWVLRWVTTTVGGELIRSDGDDGRLHVRCPVRDPPEPDTGDDAAA